MNWFLSHFIFLIFDFKLLSWYNCAQVECWQQDRCCWLNNLDLSNRVHKWLSCCCLTSYLSQACICVKFSSNCVSPASSWSFGLKGNHIGRLFFDRNHFLLRQLWSARFQTVISLSFSVLNFEIKPFLVCFLKLSLLGGEFRLEFFYCHFPKLFRNILIYFDDGVSILYFLHNHMCFHWRRRLDKLVEAPFLFVFFCINFHGRYS